MKGIRYTTILILIFISLEITAQDLHFSQFWNTPLLQNPSFAGKSEGNARAIVNHRTQWGSITSSPFKTFGASVDMRLHTSPKNNFLAGGISAYTDVAGASKMRTTLVNLAAAYHIKIDNQSYISGGVQGGINQKSINSHDLRYDNQFDGTAHNPGINSNENLFNISELKPTFSAGISYIWSNKFKQSSSGSNGGKKKINLGFAAHHFNSPSFHFSNQEKLGLKYIASVEGDFGVSYKWTVQPAAFTAFQNKATDIVFGTLFRYTIVEESQLTVFRKSIFIGFGGYYRLKDAIIPTVEAQWASFNLGFSYDVNLSDLSGASKGRGGFELSLKYISQQNSAYGRKSGARYL